MKKVRVEEYFADKELFLRSVRSQMSSRGRGGYTDQEVYRLKKIVLKLKQKLYSDEDSGTVSGSLYSVCGASHISGHE